MKRYKYKMELSGSAEMIREARIAFKKMPMERKIDLMVEAGVLTAEQADRAKKKLAEERMDK